MSEDKKEIKPVGMKGSLQGLFGGVKPTNDSNVHELAVSDKNLILKTKVNDPLAMSVLDLLGIDAQLDGYFDLAEDLQSFSTFLRGNLASDGGWRSNQLERIYTARHVEEVENAPLEGKEKLVGKGGRR